MEVLSSPGDIKARLQKIRDHAVNVTQWEPIVATGAFVPVVGPPIQIDQGQEITLFLDRVGGPGDASGLTALGFTRNTRADASFGGGEVPNGQIILLEGLQLTVTIGGAGGTSDDLNQLISLLSVRFNLRERPLDMGAVADWPSVGGVPALSGNGFQIVGMVEFNEPVYMQPQDRLRLRLRAEADISLTTVDPVLIRAKFSATRIYSQRVLGTS